MLLNFRNPHDFNLKKYPLKVSVLTMSNCLKDQIKRKASHLKER